jgi:hypothetical protein
MAASIAGQSDCRVAALAKHNPARCGWILATLASCPPSATCDRGGSDQDDPGVVNCWRRAGGVQLRRFAHSPVLSSLFILVAFGLAGIVLTLSSIADVVPIAGLALRSVPHVLS